MLSLGKVTGQNYTDNYFPMALQTLDVSRKERGPIWIRKPVALSDNGLMVKITRSASNALDLHARNIRFLHVAFDIHGNRFIAGDYQGNVQLFDLNKNHFQVLQRTGSSCTAVAFNLRRKTEFLVAHSDYSLCCYDTESKEMVAQMKGHTSAIQNISVHASGRYAVTTSSDNAILWDLSTFKIKHRLNMQRNVGIVKVFFLPLSNTIVSCFKDGSIFAWDVDTLKCKYQLPTPPEEGTTFKAVTATRHGRLLVAGGKSKYLHVYDLDTRRILRILQLPEKVKVVKQLEFLPDSFDGGANQVLGVLSQDGIMRFIDIHSSKLLFDIGSTDNKLTNTTVSPNGKHIVGITYQGDMNLYSVEELYSEINQPPPPLLKVIKGNKMANSTAESDKFKKKSTMKKPLKAQQNAMTDSTSTENSLPGGMSLERLLRILKEYGEYPEKYRMFIWRTILKIPENHSAAAALIDKGTHPSYENLHEVYPIKSRKLLRVLQRTVSALAHWSPLFGETDYLPMLTFPFVKLFQNNQLICFEMLATILMNWCQHWFEYFPNPPINVLGMVENLLAYHDKELLRHFVTHGVTSQIYTWPLLQTLLSEVFTREEWLRLFDNVFSNHPSFLLMVVASYSICSRGALLRCTETDDFKFFFHHRNAVDIGQVIKEAYHLMDITPEDIHPERLLEEFTPLTVGQYPVFNKYPKFIVDYQVQERERIRQEEMEYLRQRQLSLELQENRQKKQSEEDAWYRQQQLLLDAEDRRRNLIVEEENKLAHQRTRLQAMNRETKVKEMQQLDATRQKFRNFQQQRKEAEIRRLDDELRRKMTLRDTETQAALDDVEIRNMELAMQKGYLEQELLRNQVDSDLRQEADVDARRKQEVLESQVHLDMADAEKQREIYARQELQRHLADTDRRMHDNVHKNRYEQHQRLDDLDREHRTAELAQIQQMNQSLEEEVTGLMQELNLKKKKVPTATLR